MKDWDVLRLQLRSPDLSLWCSRPPEIGSEALKLMDELHRAERAIARAELCCGLSRLLSKAGDARHAMGLLGNVPLLFTEAAYAWAAHVIG